MLERNLERKVVAYCKANGILCYKFTSPAHRGVPDRLLIKNGKVLFLELKKKGEEPTRLQYHEIQKLRSEGMVAEWTDNYRQAIDIISEHFAA